MMHSEQGFSVIENLVALLILSFALAATLPMLTRAYQSSHAMRHQAAILAEIDDMVSGYRSQSLFTVLQNNLNPNPLHIQDGDSNTILVEAQSSPATYNITFTAVKTQPIGAPEAVRILFEVEQRRGLYGDLDYSFETMITELG